MSVFEVDVKSGPIGLVIRFEAESPEDAVRLFKDLPVEQDIEIGGNPATLYLYWSQEKGVFITTDCVSQAVA
jgi:hypothetical protein